MRLIQIQEASESLPGAFAGVLAALTFLLAKAPSRMAARRRGVAHIVIILLVIIVVLLILILLSLQ